MLSKGVKRQAGIDPNANGKRPPDSAAQRSTMDFLRSIEDLHMNHFAAWWRGTRIEPRDIVIAGISWPGGRITYRRPLPRRLLEAAARWVGRLDLPAVTTKAIVASALAALAKLIG